MLNLFFRTRKAKDKAELENVAKDVRNYYKTIANNTRKTNFVSPISSTTTTFFEVYLTHSLINETRQNVSQNDVFFFSSVLPFTVFQESNTKMKIRTITSICLGTLFTKKDYINFLKGIPFLKKKYFNDTFLVFSSFYHVLSTQFTCEVTNINPIDVLLRTFSVSLIYKFNDMISHFIHNRFPSIPPKIIFALLSYLSVNLIESITKFGHKQTFFNYCEKILSYIINEAPQTLPLDVNVDIPEDLICPICHDILKSPKESYGFFFCADCINRWISYGNHVHPCTAETITSEMIKPSLLMDTITNKWIRFTINNEEN